MMPMLEPNATKALRPNLAFMLRKARRIAFVKLMFLTGLVSFLSVGFLWNSTSCVLSEISEPLSILRTLVQCEATLSECVTIKTSLPLSAISLIISSTVSVVSASKAPVGSSAIITSGSLIKARAMATRCFWPPEIASGFLCICSPKPT